MDKLSQRKERSVCVYGAYAHMTDNDKDGNINNLNSDCSISDQYN